MKIGKNAKNHLKMSGQFDTKITLKSKKNKSEKTTRITTTYKQFRLKGSVKHDILENPINIS